MMTESPKSSPWEEICQMCKRVKSKHTNEEMLACSRKLQEFKKILQEMQELNNFKKSLAQNNFFC